MVGVDDVYACTKKLQAIVQFPNEETGSRETTGGGGGAVLMLGGPEKTAVSMPGECMLSPDQKTKNQDQSRQCLFNCICKELKLSNSKGSFLKATLYLYVQQINTSK